MSSMTVEKSARINASPQDCISALHAAIAKFPRISVSVVATAINTVELNRKMSLGSPGNGENIFFSARPGNGYSDVIISVSPKGVPYLLWRQTCEKVAQEVFSAFSAEVEKYIVPFAIPSQPVMPSTADEIKKYKELLDMGAITAEEYEAKKKQLLRL